MFLACFLHPLQPLLTAGPGLGVSLGTPTTGQPFCHSILSIIINLPGCLFILPADTELAVSREKDQIVTIYPGVVVQPPFSINLHNRPVTRSNKRAVVTLRRIVLLSPTYNLQLQISQYAFLSANISLPPWRVLADILQEFSSGRSN